MEVLSSIISIEGILVYCVALLMAAFYTYVRFKRRIDPLVDELKQAVAVVNTSKRDKEAFPEHYYELKEWMDSSKYLKDSWREFEETLLLPGIDFDDDKEVILNTRPTGSFFNQRNILWHKLNMRFYNAFPNILTGVGILGTFLGLVVGISLAAPGLNSENINDAKQALHLLLDGASLAFITSICGLGASLTFSWLEKKRVHRFDQHCFTLVSDLDARVEYFSAERLANKALQESKKQSFSMETFANDLAVSMAQVIERNVTQPMVAAVNDLRDSQKAANDETLEKLIKEFSESITGAAGEEMKAFATTMDTMNKNLIEQVDSLSEGQHTMQEASQKAIDDMTKAVADGAVKMKEEVSKTISDLITGVKASVDTVTGKLMDAAEQSSIQMEKATKGFESALDKLSATIDEIGDVEAATKELMDGLNQALDGTNNLVQSTKEIGEQLSATSTKMESTADKILQSTDSILDASDDVEKLVSRLEAMNLDIQSIWESYQKRFEDVDESVAALFKKLQEGLSNYAKSTNDYVLGLDKHAAKVVQELASATQELSETVETISEIMDVKQQSVVPRRSNGQGGVEEARV